MVSEKSAPDSTTKCFAYPIANTETSCRPALFEPLIWKFSNSGLNLAKLSTCNVVDDPRVAWSSYTPDVVLYLTNALSSF